MGATFKDVNVLIAFNGETLVGHKVFDDEYINVYCPNGGVEFISGTYNGNCFTLCKEDKECGFPFVPGCIIAKGLYCNSKYRKDTAYLRYCRGEFNRKIRTVMRHYHVKDYRMPNMGECSSTEEQLVVND